MNIKGIKILAYILGAYLLGGCTPENEFYENIHAIAIDSIDKVWLTAQNKMLMADGHAQMELHPNIIMKDGSILPKNRIDDNILEYVTEEGFEVSRFFSTDDASLIGKDLNVTVRIKGTEIVSNPVKITLSAPMDSKMTPEIVIPVVMHVVQTQDDVEEMYSEYTQERLQSVLDRINNVFSGKVTKTPYGVNTNIRFEFAKFNPKGQSMQEIGINRIIVKDTIGRTNKYQDFIKERKLLWPADKYMNIWLISWRKGQGSNDLQQRFSKMVSGNSIPHYVQDGVEKILPGLKLKDFPEDGITSTDDAGFIYKLQDLDVENGVNPAYTNDIIFYIGRYLGLGGTMTYMWGRGNDYCDDTMDYLVDYYSNGSHFKIVDKVYAFEAENIMDDCTGSHSSVSRDQCLRMHWVLKNCPDRWAWKSKFAFTGKE